MNINTNFNDVPLGETIRYHVGMLITDREYNPDVELIASRAFELSTSSDEAGGTGEFELKQNRLGYMMYEYLAKRIKERK